MKKASKSSKENVGQTAAADQPLPKEIAEGPAGKTATEASPQDDIAFLKAEEVRLNALSAGKKPETSAGRESKRFAEVIRKMRRLQELSQEELAEKAGLHRNFVGAIERGQMSVSLDNAERLANALGVKLKDLL